MDPFILERALPSLDIVLTQSEDNGQPDPDYNPNQDQDPAPPAPVMPVGMPPGMVRPPGQPPVRLGMVRLPGNGQPPIRLPAGMVLPPGGMVMPPGMQLPIRMPAPPGDGPPGVPPPQMMEVDQTNGVARSPEEEAKQSAYHMLQVVAQLITGQLRGGKGGPKPSFFK